MKKIYFMFYNECSEEITFNQYLLIWKLKVIEYWSISTSAYFMYTSKMFMLFKNQLN